MTGISFATETLTVLRAAWVIERGDRIADWTTATTHVITGCRVQPLAGSEVTPGQGASRDARVQRLRVFAPIDADVTALDRVSRNGAVWEVEAEPREWSSPTGVLAHIEITLRKVEG